MEQVQLWQRKWPKQKPFMRSQDRDSPPPHPLPDTPSDSSLGTSFGFLLDSCTVLWPTEVNVAVYQKHRYIIILHCTALNYQPLHYFSLYWWMLMYEFSYPILQNWFCNALWNANKSALQYMYNVYTVIQYKMYCTVVNTLQEHVLHITARVWRTRHCLKSFWPQPKGEGPH